MFKRRVLILIAALLIFPTVGFGHTMWLNLSDYYPVVGGGSVAYFGWGHRFPVDDLFDSERYLKSFYLISPSGQTKELKPNPGGFGATELRFPMEGTYILAAEMKPGFYTMYLEEGKIHHKAAPKTGLKNVILSLYYEQYAKAIVSVGKGPDSLSRPLGHKLEIIPLENPANLKGCGGHFMTVQVLFDGKPLRYCRVLATYNGFSTGDDFAYATTADGRGKARIRLIHWGQWMIKVNHKVPPTEELRDKCDSLSYTATLTFEVR